MEELLRKQFEAQFGNEWSQPVIKPAKAENTENSDASNSDSQSSDSENRALEQVEAEESEDDGPVVVKHNESRESNSQKKKRRHFMSSMAPRDPVEQKQPVRTKEDEDNLEDDLALQRLIEESHILEKHMQYSGADISFNDPMEQIGKGRLAIMEARLEKAGAKKKHQNTPMNIAKGIKAKQSSRHQKTRQDAREAGIVMAKEKKVRKERVHDRGLKINSVGKATAHGIHISDREIARFTSKSRGKGKGRR